MSTERVIRRFAHLTRDDAEHLRQMPEAMSREYEKLLQQQSRSDLRYAEHQAAGVDLDDTTVARRVHGHGAGGGWRRGLPQGAARE